MTNKTGSPGPLQFVLRWTDVSRVSERADASTGDERAPERGDGGGDERVDSPYSTHERVLAAIDECLTNPPVGLVFVELLIELDGVGSIADDTADNDDTDSEEWLVDQHLIDEAILTRIKREMAPDDVVLRTGPDRLTIIKPSLSAPAEAEGFALRVQAGLQSSLIVGEGRLKLQSAMGVAVSKAGDTAEDIVRYAAHALGDARMLGGDLMVAFDDRDRDLLI